MLIWLNETNKTFKARFGLNKKQWKDKFIQRITVNLRVRKKSPLVNAQKIRNPTTGSENPTWSISSLRVYYLIFVKENVRFLKRRFFCIVCTIYYHIKKNIYVCTLGKENVNCGLSLHLHSAVINQKAW